MTTPESYATAEKTTVTVLLQGLDYLQGHPGQRLDPCDPMDEGERDLYRALIPELALNDGDDITLEDVEQALENVPLDVKHKHVFDINLSAQGPTTWLRAEARGGHHGDLEVTAVTYHYSYAPEYTETPLEAGDPRWRFAVQAVERMAEGG